MEGSKGSVNKGSNEVVSGDRPASADLDIALPARGVQGYLAPKKAPPPIGPYSSKPSHKWRSCYRGTSPIRKRLL